MAISCHLNGTLCKAFSIGNTKPSNNIIGFIIGSVAFLVFIVLIVLLMYMLCCKGYCRQKLKDRFRPSQKPSITTDVNQEQPQLNSQTSIHEQPPSYQEINGI